MFLKQSTAYTFRHGPFVDEDDGKTAETGLTLSQADIRLSKGGGDFAQKNESSASSHDEIGFYIVVLDTTDTNTVGELLVAVHESGALPVFKTFQVVEEAIYDAIYGGSADLVTKVDAIDDLIDTEVAAIKTVVDSNATKLDTIDGIVDNILLDTVVIGAAGAGLTAVPWNAAWDAEVQSEVTDSLVAHNLDHLMLTAVASNADMTTEIADGTVLSNLMSKTGDTSDYAFATDSLEALGEASAPSAAAIADQIFDEALSGHTTGGTLGIIANDWIDGGRLDLLLDGILADTAEIGTAGAGLTEAGGTGDQLTAVVWNAAWDAEVQSEVTDALVAHNLDHLMKTAVASNADMTTEIADGTVLSNLMSKTGDTSDYAFATDSLEALGEAAVTVDGVCDTTLATLGTWTGTGINTVLGAFKAVLSASASMPSDMGGSGDPADCSLPAIRTRGDAAWITYSGGSEAADWTDTEKSHIRYRLGVDGTVATPASNQPNLTCNVTGIEGSDPTDQITTACTASIGAASIATPANVTASTTALTTLINALDDADSAAITAACTSSLNSYDPPTNTELTAVQTAVTAAITALENVSTAEVNTACDSAISDATLSTAAALSAARTSIEGLVNALEDVSLTALNAEVDQALIDHGAATATQVSANTTTVTAAITALENVSEAEVLTKATAALTTYDPPTNTELTAVKTAILAAVDTFQVGDVNVTVSSSPTTGGTITLKRGNKATLTFTTPTITMAGVLLGIRDTSGKSMLKISGTINSSTEAEFDISAADSLKLRDGIQHNLDVFEVAGYTASTGAYTDANHLVTAPVIVTPLYLRLETD